MILEFIFDILFNPIWLLFSVVLDMLPINLAGSDNLTSLVGLLGKAFVFVPFESFCLLVSTITGWYLVHVTWAIVEWIYRKIPGVS